MGSGLPGGYLGCGAGRRLPTVERRLVGAAVMTAWTWMVEGLLLAAAVTVGILTVLARRT